MRIHQSTWDKMPDSNRRLRVSLDVFSWPSVNEPGEAVRSENERAPVKQLRKADCAPQMRKIFLASSSAALATENLDRRELLGKRNARSCIGNAYRSCTCRHRAKRKRVDLMCELRLLSKTQGSSGAGHK